MLLSLEIDQIYLQMDTCRRIFARSAKILHLKTKFHQNIDKIPIFRRVRGVPLNISGGGGGGVAGLCSPPPLFFFFFFGIDFL